MLWSRPRKPGRPKIDVEIRKLIRRMSRENPLWETPRIRSELRLLGYEVSNATVDKYRLRHPKPPSQAWRTFLDNHARDVVAAHPPPCIPREARVGLSPTDEIRAPGGASADPLQPEHPETER